MKKIIIPEGVSVVVKDDSVHISGKLGKNERKFNKKLLSVKFDKNEIIIENVGSKAARRKGEMAENSLNKEITTDIKGVNESHHEIKMEVVYAHFPMTVETKDNLVIIKNMLGERSPRNAKIEGNTKVEAKGKDIRVYGSKLDDVSQTAANIRKVSKVRNKDERIFQDGIYYVV